LFVKLPRLFPDVDFVFRPHPLLLTNLTTYKVWTKNQVDEYMSRLLESPNIQYDKSGDYFEQFANSDAMIHDCGSFIGEYLYTKNPCCYMIKPGEDVNKSLVPLGQRCMDNYYHAYTEEDIINFIRDVIIDGQDEKKDKRESFVENELMVNYPRTSEFVIKMLKDELKVNKKTK
jgi:hypothetical protein